MRNCFGDFLMILDVRQVAPRTQIENDRVQRVQKKKNRHHRAPPV